MRQTERDDDPYQAIVEQYDLEHDRFAEDLSLIEHLVETVGDPVLELACGSGRVLERIAVSGWRATGVDSSAAMMHAARRRLAGAGVQAELIKADMTALPLPDAQFGVAVLALNGLLHATTSGAQREVLTEAFRCLDPRGMLYVDVANPVVSWPTPGIQPAILEGTWQSEGGNIVQKFQSAEVDQARQIVATSLWYDTTDPEGGLRRQSTSFELRYLHAAELELMLKLAGFAEWQIYGSYDLEPFAAESPRIVVMAEKTPSR